MPAKGLFTKDSKATPQVKKNGKVLGEIIKFSGEKGLKNAHK